MRLGQTDHLDTSADSQYVTFMLADVEYALPILKIREIIPLGTIRAIPNTPAHVRGVMDVRGFIIPVIDLRARLGVPASADTPFSVVVVVKLAWEMAGLVVDSVTDILSLPRGDIQPVDDVMAAVDKRFVRGVARTDDRLVLLLDPERAAGGE
jgi:purine-binding chemotaxis protein CheW